MQRLVFTLVAACALVGLATLSIAAERAGESAACNQGVSCGDGVTCSSGCSDTCQCDQCGECGGCGKRRKCKHCGQCSPCGPTCNCLHCRRGFCWDGRCDQTSYLPENFRYYGFPVQLGADAFTYWRRPMCAEEKYGYSTPGFNFFTVRGTFDPNSGLGNAEQHCPTHNVVTQRPTTSVKR